MCMCVGACVYKQIHMYTYACVSAPTCMIVCVFVRVCICVCANVYDCVCVRVCVFNVMASMLP